MPSARAGFLRLAWERIERVAGWRDRIGTQVQDEALPQPDRSLTFHPRRDRWKECEDAHIDAVRGRRRTGAARADRWCNAGAREAVLLAELTDARPRARL